MKREEYVGLIEAQIASLPGDVPFPLSPDDWAPIARGKQEALSYALEMLPKYFD